MIEVIQPGIQTTLQDMGRFGYRNQGVPLSGAMDQYSSQLVNQLLGNQLHAAVMEFVLKGPELLFHKATTIAIAGGHWDIELNGKKVDQNEIINVQAGSALKIAGIRKGMYGYLAVQGGFEEPEVLGSYSYYNNITDQAKIEEGQKIKTNTAQKYISDINASVTQYADLLKQSKIEVYQAPEFYSLSEKMQKQLLQKSFQIAAESNRMAVALKHDLKITAREITTGPVQPGTVQLTPSGKMIVLMRDAQTTGGYARILQLAPMAINQLAQKRPGEKIIFKAK